MDDLITGDMPGDKIQIGESHTKRAEAIFPHLQKAFEGNRQKRFVVSVYGGSGVGKSEIGSLLGTYFQREGIPSYVLSGDNYPFRIPEMNDEERLNRFRYGALRALSTSEDFSSVQMSVVQKLREEERDSSRELFKDFPFLQDYYTKGRAVLEEYLGTGHEIDFPQINAIIQQFKKGDNSIVLKRMGRTLRDISYEKVDFSHTRVFIIEWTHGNNRSLKGVDYPVYLFSTPEETLAHRLSRGRDKAVDSSFTSLVLDIEQKLLNSQAENASLIVSKSAEIISLEEMRKRIK